MSSSLSPSTSVLRDLRICFLAGTLGQGGAERQLYYILKCLKESGSDVTLLSLTKGEHWQKPIEELGVPVRWVGQHPSRIARLLKITKTLSKLKSQVVQAQHFYVNLYAALAARFSGCRSVGAIRNDVFSEMTDVGALLGRASLRLPRILASNSRAAIRNLVDLGVPEERLFFLPNVVDDSHFAPGSLRPVDPFVILGVGRLVPQKRFDLFLQVLAQVSSRFPVRGVIAGTGPLRPELETQARQLGLLPGQVEFVGRVEDAPALYRRATVFLLTSDHEGTPNVVLEAMASGVPVVGTRVGDVPDILGNGQRGRLSAPGDLSGLASTLGDLLADAPTRTRLADHALACVRSQHSPGALSDQLMKLYSLALAP